MEEEEEVFFPDLVAATTVWEVCREKIKTKQRETSAPMTCVTKPIMLFYFNKIHKGGIDPPVRLRQVEHWSYPGRATDSSVSKACFDSGGHHFGKYYIVEIIQLFSVWVEGDEEHI